MKPAEKSSSPCPFVKSPFPDCYCFNLTSRNIDSAISFCGSNFRECEIYKNNFYLGEIYIPEIEKTA